MEALPSPGLPPSIAQTQTTSGADCNLVHVDAAGSQVRRRGRETAFGSPVGMYEADVTQG